LVQWVQFLISFLSCKSELISEFEEVRCDINKPFWVYGANFSHILLGGEDKLVIDDPLWFLVEKSTAWMDIDLMVVNQRSVASFRVLTCSMEEKS
jgi:hypothetical protein